MDSNWAPASLRALRSYSLTTFAHDAVAGVTVGLVALPLAMAFAIASGLSPQAGIYCAIVTGFLISALGGSRCQIGGPTGAFVVVVAGIVAEHGVNGLFMCTMMAGVMLVVLGATGMGNGGQVPAAPGRRRVHERHRRADREHADQGLPRAADRGASRPSSRRAMRGARRAPRHDLPAARRCWRRRRSASILVHAPSRAARSRHHRRPARRHRGRRCSPASTSRRSARASAASRPACPTSRVPHFDPALIPTLLRPALTVAMLGAIESLMSAVVADRMSGDRHNPNVELVAQGVANIASPLFGGLPATGAIARTATNIRVGRPHAGGRDDPRPDAAGRAARRRAARALHPDAGARRDPDGRRLQHGRVARDPEAAPADQDRHRRLARRRSR